MQALFVFHRGSGHGTPGRSCAQRGRPSRKRDATRNAAGTGAVWLGVGEVHSTIEAGESRWREGASLLEGFGRGEGAEDWR